MKKSIFMIFFLIGINYFNCFAQNFAPGDGVRIIFYNISDKISGDYYIQKDGTISFPFIGQIDAIDRNVDSVTKDIINKYSTIYREPEITVLPLFRINILGEVRNPGAYYVTGSDKLSDLIAQAGGTTSEADLGDILITRENKEVEIDGEKIIQNGKELDDIGLQSGDRIFVSRKWFSGATSTIIISAVAAIATIITAIIYSRNR